MKKSKNMVNKALENPPKVKDKWVAFIEAHIKECDISYRGGTVKIDVSELFPSIAESENGEEAIMGAYKNYLGGGVAGAIVSGQMFDKEKLSKKERVVFEELNDALKKWFYNQNNGGGDEYMQEEENKGYIENQNRAVSGY